MTKPDTSALSNWGSLKLEDAARELTGKTFTAIGSVELGAESAARRAERYRIQAEAAERMWPHFLASVIDAARAAYPDATITQYRDEIHIVLLGEIHKVEASVTINADGPTCPECKTALGEPAACPFCGWAKLSR